MISGNKYIDVKKKLLSFSGFTEDGDFYTNASELRALSSEFNVTLGKRMSKFTSWSNIPDKAIVAINYREGEDGASWHWVVFCRNKNNEFFIDPKKAIKTHKRTDFGRVKVKWYLPIIKKLNKTPTLRKTYNNNSVK